MRQSNAQKTSSWLLGLSHRQQQNNTKGNGSNRMTYGWDSDQVSVHGRHIRCLGRTKLKSDIGGGLAHQGTPASI